MPRKNEITKEDEIPSEEYVVVEEDPMGYGFGFTAVPSTFIPSIIEYATWLLQNNGNDSEEEEEEVVPTTDNKPSNIITEETKNNNQRDTQLTAEEGKHRRPCPEGTPVEFAPPPFSTTMATYVLGIGNTLYEESKKTGKSVLEQSKIAGEIIMTNSAILGTRIDNQFFKFITATLFKNPEDESQQIEDVTPSDELKASEQPKCKRD